MEPIVFNRPIRVPRQTATPGEDELLTQKKFREQVSGMTGGTVVDPVLPEVQGDTHFLFSQLVASATWTIIHNLGRYPAVTVIDSAGNIIVGAVEYVDTNTLIIGFSAPFSGKAALN